MRLKIILISSCVLAVVLALQVFAFCQDAQISASVDEKEITIGDSINYTVLITLPVNAECKEPFAAESLLGEFEIRDFKWSVTKDKAQQFRLDYILSIFTTGEHIIPAYNIEFRATSKDQWQALSAKEIATTVKSVLSSDAEKQKLKPLKPKIIIWRDYILWIIILVLIAGAVWAGFKFRQVKHKAQKEQVIVEAAHVIAYRELEQLERANLIARGLIEEYYEKLSGLLRRYLENRFFLRAPWMSTEEFLKEVKASPVLNAAQRTALKDFLLLSDLVKFACYGSSAPEAADAFAGARSFIDQTKQEEKVEEKNKK